MTDKISIRRVETNKFYISILTGLLAVQSFGIMKSIDTAYHNIVIMTIGILGIAFSYLWKVNINSYKQLNSSKFKVIHELEKHLPYPCYDTEWEFLSNKESNDGKKYHQLTKVEKSIPIVMGLLYLLLTAYSIYKYFR